MTEGSRAGTAAPIHLGYYLVGRNKECQIRPKSKSVSRRHSLLLHNEDGFGVMDLKSTGGTFLNGERIEPHVWQVLNDGDELRFGKVGFAVSMKTPALAVTPEADSVADPASTSETPQSWQNFDVAQFLEAEDQIEQEIRYDSIRQLPGNKVNGSKVTGLSKDADDAEINLAELEHDAKSHDTFIGNVPDADAAGEDVEKLDVEVDAQPKKKPPRKIDPKEYKRKPKRSFQMPRFGGGFDTTFDWKTTAMIFVAIGIISFLGYQIYSFSAGPEIEVRESLD
ncbi:FHA domain-containing protein [Stieleria sp. JC731]|nr:FHA domain-containing protein [Stieleria sp. JC731]